MEDVEAATQACGLKLSKYPEGYPTTAQYGVSGSRHNIFNGMAFLVSIFIHVKVTMMQYIEKKDDE